MATSEARAAWRPYEESEHQKSIHTQDQAHLETRDTDANVRSLNHANIVATVTNTAYPLLSEFADEPRNVSFLRRRASTSDDSRKLRGDLNELVLEQVEAELGEGQN